ncbi:mesoderm induction early response protein 3 isoform X1 [Ornithorhynchus anatinus]|uniref:mesoderm induction early response protein 3 isoform X1 n=1 Tax=Ornithorhynchus anatinus TaxID=9258 RepID=UPI0004548B34|nr:mesoderm induction early response protein 3 isoform X1 [Ornithorhynchus anatinus]XP_028929319.1 mesoderm induction early response protein 3 isoform X1 [Ornithorhynchus anatinus]
MSGQTSFGDTPLKNGDLLVGLKEKKMMEGESQTISGTGTQIKLRLKVNCLAWEWNPNLFGSLSSEDHDFDPTAEMLVHDYDDERTLEEEEMMDEGKNFSSEIEDLEKEGNMPLEDLLAFYGYEPTIPVMATSSANSSPSELADELPDMTLDKEEIAKDLLSGDDEETQSSADDLTPSVTSHEATDFFPRPLRSNTTYDGDKESEGEDVEVDTGNSPEDLRKEIMVGLQYQAEIPPYMGKYSGNEKMSENEDQLLWSPHVVVESKVKEYLVETSLRTGNEKMMDRLSEGTHTRDNEQALYELLKCNHNIKEAIERYCCNGKASQEEMKPWTEEECRNFEHALLIYGKDFHLIQKNKVSTRTVAECVAFYYMWKKSERYDYFAQQTRFGKKRYNHHPGVTDYMDRLVDEAEALGGAVSSSALTSSRTEPVADQQLSILNSFTASDLTALTDSVAATVCDPSEVNCLDDGFPPLGGLSRGPASHVPVATEELLTLPSNGESDCFNLFETGFYHSELNPADVCGEESERPAKRLKMGLAVPEPFVSDVSVNGLGVDFENHTRHLAGAKMAVSVADFGGLSAGETNGFIGAHALHPQTALHSE